MSDWALVDYNSAFPLAPLAVTEPIAMSTDAFHKHLHDLRSLIEQSLQALLDAANWPDSLKSAVSYSLMAGGKRLRPVLTILASEACGGRQQDAIHAACAVEMIHTYSLIHDDLPAMDDDDFRRGKPSSHKVFGEATAILAGDCLLTLAFETLAEAPIHDRNRADLFRVLSSAAGGSGMVGGQVLDLEAEKDKLNPQNMSQQSLPSSETPYTGDGNPIAKNAGSERNFRQTRIIASNSILQNSVEHLTQIHRMKTGAMITAALEMGSICGNAGSEHRRLLKHYGECIGLAFQISDDLLDVVGSEAKLGKVTGRDADLGKLTYPSLLGISESQAHAERLVQEACEHLVPLGQNAVWLTHLARFIVERDH